MLKALLACVLLSVALLAQDDPVPPEPVIPSDPRAAAAAMPVQDPVDDGHVIRVVDGDNDTPIEGADVFVITMGVDPAERARFGALQERIMSALGPKASRMDVMLTMAVLEGTRYRTNTDGSVAVAVAPEPGISGFLAMHEGNLAASSTRESGPIEFFAPRWLDVRVLAADGKPAAGVSVGVAEKEEPPFDQALFFHAELVVETDRQGQCRFNVADQRIRRIQNIDELVVKALVATSKSIQQVVAINPLPEAPVELSLPECGQVRFILYDDEERPVERLRNASMTLKGLARENAFKAPASSLEADSALFDWVEVGMEVQVEAWVTGMTGSLPFAGAGPSRARELVVVQGRLTSGPPIVAVRVLDQQGNPVANEFIGHILRKQGEFAAGPESQKTVSTNFGTTQTDGDGWLEIPTQIDRYETLHLTRREAAECPVYLGAAQIDLGELHPGRCDFGDVRLQDETVFARRQLVDETGTPVAGVWVRGQTTPAGQPKGALFGGGGSSSQGQWHFEHRARSDDEGWIELREFEPIQGEFMFDVEGADYTSPGGLWIETTSRGPLRVYRTSTIQARLGEGLEAAQTEVELVHRPTGQTMRTQFNDGKLGPIYWAAGAYDIEIGRGIGVVIENVEAPAGGEISDPRLDPLDIGDAARWVHVEIVDRAGKPVPSATVWLMLKRPGGGGSGAGFYAAENGKLVLLVPNPETLGNRTCKLVVDADGYAKQTVDAPDADVRIVLKSIAPITLRVEGLPELPQELQLRMTTVAKPQRGSAFTSSREDLTGAAEIIVQPKSLGARLLQVYLEPNRQATGDKALVKTLAKRLTKAVVEFEFEVAGKAVDPFVFALSEEQHTALESRLEAIREIIAEHRDG